MAAKISKEELTTILKRITKQTSLADVQTEIEDIADEFRIDLTEPDPEEDEFFNEEDAYLEEDEIEILTSDYDDEDDDF